jgi:hypothetical protein
MQQRWNHSGYAQQQQQQQQQQQPQSGYLDFSSPQPPQDRWVRPKHT